MRVTAHRRRQGCGRSSAEGHVFDKLGNKVGLMNLLKIIASGPWRREKRSFAPIRIRRRRPILSVQGVVPASAAGEL